MRIHPLIRPAALTIAVLALGACATPRQPIETYAQTLDRLSDDCTRREGILTPTGANTGRPEADNACVIRGGASRIPQS